MSLKLEEQWAELIALLLLVIGFITAILLHNPFFNYLKSHKHPLMPLILIAVGFLLGYLIGTIWASRFVTFVFFALGFASSPYLLKRKIIGIFKSEQYLYK